MDSENRKGKALSFSVDGRDVKDQNKRKHHMGPIEISKLPQANCLEAEIDETCNWFREQCRFLSWRKIRGGEKSPVLMSKLENVC